MTGLGELARRTPNFGFLLEHEPVLVGYGAAAESLVNLLLHGIGRSSGPELIEVHDSLAEKPRRHATVVLANPPFGRKSGFSTVDEFGHEGRH